MPLPPAVKSWLGVTLLMVMLVPTTLPLFGVSLLSPLIRAELRCSAASVGWVGATSWFLIAAFAIVSSSIITPTNAISVIKAGLFMGVISMYCASLCRSVLMLFLTLGVGSGVSANLIFNSIVLYSGSFFQGKHMANQRKAAQSFSVLGIAISQVVCSVAYEYVLSFGKWYDALQLSAISMFVVGYGALSCLEAFFIGPQASRDLKGNTESNRHLTDQSCCVKSKHFVLDLFSPGLFKNVSFHFLCFGQLLFWIANIIGLMSLPSAMAETGHSDNQASMMFVQGLGQLAARTGFPAVSLVWPRVKFFKLFPLSGAILGVCFLTSFNLQHPTSYFVMSAGVGFSNAMGGAMMYIVTREIVGNNTYAWTWTMVSVGTGGFIGPIIAGVIYDVTGSFRLSFEIASTLACISSGLLTLAAICRERSKSKRRRNNAASMTTSRSSSRAEQGQRQSPESRKKDRRKSMNITEGSLAPVIFVRKKDDSFAMYRKEGKKYKFMKTVQSRNIMKPKENMQIDELFHGKFQVEDAYLPFECDGQTLSDSEREKIMEAEALAAEKGIAISPDDMCELPNLESPDILDLVELEQGIKMTTTNIDKMGLLDLSDSSKKEDNMKAAAAAHKKKHVIFHQSEMSKPDKVRYSSGDHQQSFTTGSSKAGSSTFADFSSTNDSTKDTYNSDV